MSDPTRCSGTTLAGPAPTGIAPAGSPPVTTPAPPGRPRLAGTPWWLVLLGGLGLVLVLAGMGREPYPEIARALLGGLAVTLRVTVVAYGAALALGTVIAIGLVSRRRWISEPVRAYVEVMRGVPMLVLLYYVAFALGPALVAAYGQAFRLFIEAGVLPTLAVRDVSFEARAGLALTIGYSAFLAEVMRGGIEAVPRGQGEAAGALGLSPRQAMRLVVLPQAFRTMLPPLGNDLVSMLKDSSLVSVLGVSDITQIGKTYSAATFEFFETYTVVALFYLGLTVTLSALVRRLEARLARNDRR